jgi:hypothetical protein
VRTYLCIVAAAFASISTSASAQNLVANPGFDSDLSGWSVILGDGSWSPLDCCGNPASGSASITAGPGPSSGSTLVSDCIGVTPGSSYDLVVQAETLAVPPDFLNGSGIATVTWYDNGIPCSDILAGDAGGLFIEAGTGWRSFGKTFVAPATSVAAKVTLVVQGGGLSQAIDLHFDDIRFGPAGSVPVTLQSFYVD